MRIENEGIITYSLEMVYSTLRDKLVEMVPFLPNVKEIKVLERKDLGENKLYVLNHWQGTADQIPSIARPFIKPEMVSWKDHANWDDSSYTVTWRFETYTGDKLFSCEGKNYFVATTDYTTQLKITGDLLVYPEKVPGIPGFMAKKLAPKIENFLIGRIAPNLVDMIRGLQSYLDSKKQ